ncbi:MAG: sulfatase, partial [Anaerolineae bacterium]
APYFKEERQVRDFMRNYNSQAFRWLLPVEERFKKMESAILNDMYDAEVAYQDHLLGNLLEYLCRDEIAANTLTIIVSDHGEGLGEHNFMGHSFVAYQELVHVPLIVKFPAQAAAGRRIPAAVSTRRVFHTALDTAGIPVLQTEHRPPSDVKSLTLLRTAQGKDPEHELVFVEAYAPNTFLSMMETHVPQLIETFYCNLNRRAVVQGQQKLVRIEGVQDELFDLAADPQELDDLIAQQPARAGKLSGKLDAFKAQALARRPETWQANRTLTLNDDETLAQQLRALGYIE